METVQTDVQPESGEPVEVASLAAESQDVQVLPKATRLEDWRPSTSEERARLAEIMQEVRDLDDELEKRETGVKSRLNKAIIESVGREFILRSDGGREGLIRTIDVSHFPEDIAIEVLNRYGITIEYREIRGPQGQSGTFLNAATTDHGTFTGVRRDGFFEVFVLSAKATAMLSSLELQALGDRGHDPMRTRIRRVQFGIIKDPEFPSEYALGVTELEVERIR